MDAKISNTDETIIPAPPRKGQNNGENGGRSGSALNPNAMPWEPMSNRASEDDRCLFLTFSNGYPLSKRQISKFFTQAYGPCVEKVFIPRQEHNNKPPLFGKVIFSKLAIPVMVLGGETQVKFIVDKKTLWCKKFQPKNNVNDENGAFH